MLGAHGSQKRALDLVKLELWAAGSHHVPEITESPVKDEQAERSANLLFPMFKVLPSGF